MNASARPNESDGSAAPEEATASAGNETLLLNVAVMPSTEVAAQIEFLSRELTSQGTLFTVDGVSLHAHLTLYMARFGSGRITEVRERVRQAVSALPALQLRHSGYLVTPGRYYEVSYARTDELMAAHHAVLKTLAGLRHRPGDPVVESFFGEYGGEQRENARESGYDLAGDLYRPHITVTRFKDRLDAGGLPQSPRDLSFEAGRIGLFAADANGAAVRFIASFDLG